MNYLVGVASCGPVNPSCADFALFGKFSDFYPIARTYMEQGETGGNCAATAISVGQTVNGTVDTGDCKARVRGISYLSDRYSFSGTAGQRVAILQTSSAIDTYLYLVGPDLTVVAEDDDGGGGTNSRIPSGSGFFILPATGTYFVEATSFSPNNTGNYTLSFSGPSTTRTLTASSSNPDTGVGITVTPNDNNGQGNGSTQFTRIYFQGTAVMLTAPSAQGNNNFKKWTLDGADYSTSLNATVTMDADHQMVAVYACPATMTASRTSDPIGTAALLYRFRDEVLTKTDRGRFYIQAFYQSAPELIRLLSSDPRTNGNLLLQSAALLERYKPLIQSMVDHRATIVSLADVANVNAVMNAYERQGSPQLRAIINQLKLDMANTQVQAQFGITIAR